MPVDRENNRAIPFTSFCALQARINGKEIAVPATITARAKRGAIIAALAIALDRPGKINDDEAAAAGCMSRILNQSDPAAQSWSPSKFKVVRASPATQFWSSGIVTFISGNV